MSKLAMKIGGAIKDDGIPIGQECLAAAIRKAMEVK